MYINPPSKVRYQALEWTQTLLLSAYLNLKDRGSSVLHRVIDLTESKMTHMVRFLVLQHLLTVR